jgi:hypothetical protein
MSMDVLCNNETLTLVPGVDVMILKNIFAKKNGFKISDFVSKYSRFVLKSGPNILSRKFAYLIFVENWSK